MANQEYRGDTAAPKDVAAKQTQAPAVATKEPTRKFKLLRGQFMRRESPVDHENPSGGWVTYRAGEKDVIEMTDKQAHNYGRKWLAPISDGGVIEMNEEQAKYVADMKIIAQRARENLNRASRHVG